MDGNRSAGLEPFDLLLEAMNLQQKHMLLNDSQMCIFCLQDKEQTGTDGGRLLKGLLDALFI